MQSFVNQPFLKKRATYAKWGSYVGIGALLIGLAVTQRSILISYALLLIGLMGASIGSYMANRYVHEPRADQAFDRALEGLDKRYALYHYYLPSNHVAVSHYGLTVLIPRNQGGDVSYINGKWQHKEGMRKLLQLIGEPALGKPDQDVATEIGWIQEWVAANLPEQEIPVNGAIVFTNEKVKLRVNDAPFPTMITADLAHFLKQGLKGQPTLSTAMQGELRRKLDETFGTGQE